METVYPVDLKTIPSIQITKRCVHLTAPYIKIIKPCVKTAWRCFNLTRFFVKITSACINLTAHYVKTAKSCTDLTTLCAKIGGWGAGAEDYRNMLIRENPLIDGMLIYIISMSFPPGKQPII